MCSRPREELKAEAGGACDHTACWGTVRKVICRAKGFELDLKGDR